MVEQVIIEHPKLAGRKGWRGLCRVVIWEEKGRDSHDLRDLHGGRKRPPNILLSSKSTPSFGQRSGGKCHSDWDIEAQKEDNTQYAAP